MPSAATSDVNLHDGMAQTVLAVNLNLAQVRQSAPELNATATRAMDKARELLQQMSREIRTLSYLLHPPLLDDLGLVSALKEYVHGFSERSGIQTVCENEFPFPRLPQSVETAFFRIVQESLTNIQRHSGSRHAKISLREDASAVYLEISDSGKGMIVPLNGNKHTGQRRLGVGIPRNAGTDGPARRPIGNPIRLSRDDGPRDDLKNCPGVLRETEQTPLRILIADDHAVVRAGLRALLESREGWQVCAEALDGRDAVEQVAKHKPDIAILDIGMPLLNGVEVARRVRKTSPATEVLILTMHQSDDLVQQVVEAGAHGYILKDEADRVLLAAVDALRQHKSYFSNRVSSAAETGDPETSDASKTSRSRLTPREREILQLLAEGKSNKDVANLLGISVNTAEAHRANIMVKLDVRSLADLVVYAIRNKIITT